MFCCVDYRKFGRKAAYRNRRGTGRSCPLHLFEVRLKIDGLPARFVPKPLGRWVDIETVLAGLNATLAANDRPERFAALLGDLRHVIIGNPDGLRDLVETPDLPLLLSSADLQT